MVGIQIFRPLRSYLLRRAIKCLNPIRYTRQSSFMKYILYPLWKVHCVLRQSIRHFCGVLP